MHRDAERWNRRYRSAAGPPRFAVEPALAALDGRLGRPGLALDVACGTGAHALWLAERGWRAVGMDVSVEGLRLARAEARRRGLAPAWVVGDALAPPIGPAVRFDLVVVVRYLERALFPWIASVLAPGGRAFCATFNRGHLARNPGFNPAFVLAPGELAPALAPLRVEATEEGETVSWILARR